MGVEPHLVWWQWSLVPLVALIFFGLFVLVARAVRLGTRKTVDLLSRLVPRPAAYVGGLVIVVVVIVGAIQGFLLRGILNFAENAASLADQSTSPGIVRPTSPLLSGSPASLESWDSLGAKGRDFIGQVTTSGE